AGLGIVEVKSTTRVKEQHLPDVALQAHVLGCTGLDVARLEIMHLNRACAHPDLRDLFVRREVTEAARSAREAMPRAVDEQRPMWPAAGTGRRRTSAPSRAAAGPRGRSTT